MPPKSIPLRYIYDFEMKLLKKQLMQKGHSSSPSSPCRQETNFPCKKHPLSTRRVEVILTTRNREFRAKKTVQTNLVTSSLITTSSPNPFILLILHKFIASLSKRYKSYLLWPLPVWMKLNFIFSCYSVLCQFKYQTSQRIWKERKEKFFYPYLS